MGKPSAPKPPDPKDTSQAQTGTSVGTAIANTMLGNVNQVTPQGSLNYDQTGSYTFTDPYTGQSYDIPTFTATSNLSPGQQQIYDAQTQAQLGMSQTAAQQADRLQSLLGQDFTPENLPRFGQTPNVPGLNTQAVQGGPLQSQVGNPTLNTAAVQGGDIASGYGPAGNFGEDRQRIEAALMERMNPYIERDRNAMESRLANQGIGVGARAYSAAQGDFSRGVNDARLGAILGAGDEQARLVGMERDRAQFQNAAQSQGFGQGIASQQAQNAAFGQQFGQNVAAGQFQNAAQGQDFSQGLASQQAQNAALGQLFGMNMQGQQAQNDLRAQALQQQMAMRNQPINEITALLSGSQVSMPNFRMNQPSPIPTTDNAGLINQNYAQQMQNYNSQMGAWNGLWGGLFGLGSSAIMASDRRLKADARRVGMRDGLPLWEYRYLWEPPGFVRRGYMAHEVAKVRPDAVVVAGPWLALDYAKLPEVA